MSSSVKSTQTKASNPSVPLANSAWSKGPPQSSATSRAQSPANVPNPPAPQSRRQSTLGPSAPPTVKQTARGMAGTGHRSGSINFGSIDASQPSEKKAETTTTPATAPVPAMTPATAPKPAQPTNGVKVVAPTPTQPAPASATTAPATTTTPAVAATPPGATPTPSKQKKINVYALFQGGGLPSVTTTPPVTSTPAASAPPPQVVAPAAPPPRGAQSAFNDRNNPVQFPRSPQISRPTLPGPSTSGGQRPAGSPRMSASVPLQHQHQHPMVHPHHHSPHPGHPMQAPQQWGPAGYYYPPPHDYNPYMYWGGHPQHQHPHMPQIHQPSMQPSPRPPNAQPRPPSTPPVPNNVSPHPPPINTSLQAPPSAPSPSLNVTAPTFVPGGLRRTVNPIRISTPNGDAVTFESQLPASPKVTTPIPPKRQSVAIRMETEQQKIERLAKEQEEKAREAKEKAEKERKEKERVEEEKRVKEEAERKEKEEAERKVKEEEERKAKEEADRKAEEERKAREEAELKAEEERKAKEEEDKRIAEELRVKEEAERKAKEEEERKAREEAERLEAELKAKEEAERKAKAKEEEERKAKEEAEAIARTEAEAKAKAEAEKAKAEAEAAAKEAAAKEEAEAKEAAAEEARDTVSASPLSSPKPANGLLPSTVPDRPSPLSVSSTPGRPSPLSISTTGERPKRPVPGPLDLTSAQGNRSAAPPSALASARIIEDLNLVPYPEAIKTPNPDLNIAATPGKFRYDRDFLLQFMGVCKERPDSLPALDMIGLEPGEGPAGYPNVRPERRRVGSTGMSGAPPLHRQASTSSSIGLGLGGSGLANRSGFAMGNFQSPSNSQSRFEASNTGRAGMPFAGGAASRLTPMSRSASQGGVGGGNSREAKRTRSQRGRDRGDNPRASGFQTPANQASMFEPVVPLEATENRWVAGSTQRSPQQVEERQLVDRKVKALLNKLTMEKFDSISDQIIEWANKSEQEKDGSTLMQVIKLVFEKAKDEAAFSEMYARLCRKMMERVSPNVQDETIKNSEGQPITGGMLFRKYLLNRCQEDFERGWSAKEAALAAAALKSGEDKAAEAASGDSGEAVLYSEEYYAAAKAKRQGLGLVRFIGELFKLQMLTERIMHECIKKLLSNVVNPEEEEIESLCKLLTTVGQSLDNPKAKNHMDIYFERMQDMAKSNSINSRMQYMLLDVIEFRSRNWQARSTLPRPPPAHQDSRDDSGKHGVSRGGSRRGEHRGNAEPDGWNVAGGAGTSRPSTRAGDLSQFGKISKPTGIQFGPSSVFSKKDASKRDSSIGRAGGANMFSALSPGGADGPPAPPERTTSSRKPSVDLGPSGSPAAAGAGSTERRKLVLQPRTKPAETDANKGEDKEEEEEKGEEKEEAAPAAMTEEEYEKKVKEDVKEYLGVENIDEAIMALETLPSERRHMFVDRLVNASMDGGNKVVVLAEKLFSAARERSVISPEGFVRGLLPTIEMADDLSIDVPKTYEWLARMIHAAGLDRAKTEEMARTISVLGEPRVPPSELLIKEFEKVSST